MFIFAFVSLAWGDVSRKILLRPMSRCVLLMFPSRIFMVSVLTFKSLIHFEFIFLYGVRSWSNFILFFACICPFSSTAWRHYPFFTKCSFLIRHKSIIHICVDLFLGSQSCSIDLCICFFANAMLLWLLRLCNIVWNQGV